MKKTANKTVKAKEAAAKKPRAAKKTGKKNPVVMEVGNAAEPKPAPKQSSEVIWKKIKNAKLNIYGMDVKLEDDCSPVFLDPEILHLKYRSPAALPAIEDAIGDLYEVFMDGKLIAVRPRAVLPKRTPYVAAKLI